MTTSLAQPTRSLELSAGLVSVRELVRATAMETTLSPPRVAEIVLAAHEVAMNALTHGEGTGALRIGAANSELVCEVEDRGPGISDPFTGSALPDTDCARGRGLWIARQLCDRLEIESAPGRTLVRLHWRLH